MTRFFTICFLSTAILFGCGQDQTGTIPGISGFIDLLEENGIHGDVTMEPPFNDDMEYIATYKIAVFTSTRIISIFKFKTSEKAQFNLEEAMKNPRMAGQARNGTFVMAATFFPPDEAAVAAIRDLFVSHEFVE
jgi:hypothetical protein